MQWKKEYAIGIPEIDNQHKTLLGFISEFEREVAGDAHWNTLYPLLVRAREFVKFHFAVEESLMQIVDYPGLVGHKAEHAYVVQRFSDLENRVLRLDMNTELVPMISTWLFDHIIDSDRPLGRYVLDHFRTTKVA